MNVHDSPPIILSRYDNHVIEWDGAALNAVLGQLRQERQHIDKDADTNALLAAAEAVKDNANDIHEVDASQ